MASNSFLSKALSLFNIKPTQTVGQGSGSLEPNNPLLHKGRRGGLHLQNYSELQEIWSFYLQECCDTSESLQNRRNRYLDLDFATKNNTLIKSAADLFADEGAQCDIDSCPVRVKAKKDVQSFIADLLDSWGITQPVTRETLWNKVLFGDAFEINDVRPKEGIVQSTPVTVWDVADRIEFDPSKVMERLKYHNTISGAANRTKLDVLMAELQEEGESPSSFFNKYHFGFELLGGRMTPPWGVTHYRSMSLLREFAPWGRSRFVNILPMFRQLISAEGLMQVARAVSFPRDVYSVGSEPGATATEKWTALEEFREQLDNAGLHQGTKELPSIGSRIIVPKDLVDFNSFKSDIDVDAISDVEYLRDNLIMGLMIPKGYLIVDNGGAWGTSGQSLLQQFKPFGRLVFSDQSDYMRGLTEKIKIHLAIVNKFEGWDTPFELEMVFPVIEESGDRIRQRAEELTLANNTLDTLKSILGVDKVPPEIVKDAFGMLTSIPQERLDLYIDKLIKFNPDPSDNQEGEDEDSLGFGGGVMSDVNPASDLDTISKTFGESAARSRRNNRTSTTSESFKRARNRWQESSAKDSFQEEIIRLKANCKLYEGKGNGTHYFSSLRNTPENIKSRKVFEAFNELSSTGKSFSLREHLTEKRDDKDDHERWLNESSGEDWLK